MIEKPPIAILPFLVLLMGGMYWKVSLLLSTAFLYQGIWCVYCYRRCATPHCGVTGPLYLLIALFSLLGWSPPFNSSTLAWSNWDHLFLVFWLGTTAALSAQWLTTRHWKDFGYMTAFLVASLIVYASY